MREYQNSAIISRQHCSQIVALILLIKKIDLFSVGYRLLDVLAIIALGLPLI